MSEFPTYITHYYSQGSDVLKNVCSQPDKAAEALLDNLKATGRRTWLHPGYLEERRTVEAWLRSEFVRKGGKPYLQHPLYFVLGENDDFFQKNGFFSDATPAKLQLPLSLFNRHIISFTYPDSMPSLAIATDQTGRAEPYRKPIHGQIFSLEELPQIVRDYGMPGDRWKTEEHWRYDRFIEAQVWDDRPIWDFVQSSCLQL